MKTVPPPVSDAAWEDPYPTPPPSPWRRWRWLGLLPALGLLTLLVLVVQDRLLWPREPEYQGRRLSAWMRGLTSPDPAVNLPARLAVLALGTNALPALERHLQASDSWLGQLVTAAQNRLPRRLWIAAMQATRARNALERRWQAAVALNTLGPRSAPARVALARALEDPEPRVVTNAAEALFHIGPPAWPALTHALRSPNEHTFNVAAAALRRVGAAASNQTPEVVAVFFETSAPRREQLTPLLAALGDSAVPVLGAHLAHTNAALADLAARTLQAMMRREFAAQRGVAALLKHPDPRVRRGATRVLGGEVPWPRTSLNALVGALADSETSVRLAAAEALADAATWTDMVTNALPTLRRLIESTGPEERETYQRVLSRLEALGSLTPR